MKVVVTGAAGYIGRHVVVELLEKGHEVYAIDLRKEETDSRAVFLNLDIFSGNINIYDEMMRPDLCIHLAWQDGFVHNSPKHIENLSKHFVFLKNLAEGGCPAIAVMGTMHEVGYWEGAIDENTPCNPLSQYGIAKNALRQSLMLLTEKMNTKIYWLRAYYILGDDEKNNSIFSKLLIASKEGKAEFPFTTGENQYDFITVKDLAKQIVAAATQDKYSGIINVCTGNPIPLRDMVESFIQNKNLNIRLKIGAFPDRPYDSKIIYGDASIIRKILKGY